MKRQIHRLSAKGIIQQKRAGYWPDGGGLYLQVTPARTKSWIFRFTLNGRSREMGLGPLDTVSLADARNKARDCRILLDRGIDPIEVRREKRSQEALEKARAISFSECAKSYIKAHGAKWRNEKHAGQWESTIKTYAEPVIGSLAVQDIDTALVLKVLEPIWNEKNETATRLRSRVESVLDWATARGYRTGDNPARWRGHLSKLLPAIKKRLRVKNHPALPYSEIGSFIQSLRTQEGTAARALEFAILTAARTNEVTGSSREEFDLNKGIWTIPASRMKSGREHRVPLSPRALQIIKGQGNGDYIFPGQKEGKPLSNMAMLTLLKRMGRRDITVHGFRSSFRDWSAETTAYPREVCEMALAHVISNHAEAAYRRGDLFEKRRRMMRDWEKYCEQVSKAGKTVVPIKQGAA
ncbi:MAG: integrase arm-type DNA-binding domain-containing protein [Gammaproteobacteria bacterium]|nr:integrase arm-type DNA-binding domain-containing protein [Gammaproteobacteria bacterium]